VSNLRRLRRSVAATRPAKVEAPEVEGNVGKRNAYACPVCGGLTVTIDVDPGVTPAFLACRAAGDVDLCTGVARSFWYRVNGLPIGEPAWEWYRPTEQEARRLDPYSRSHVGMGGLLLRKR
jgi:hypothetical protein